VAVVEIAERAVPLAPAGEAPTVSVKAISKAFVVPSERSTSVRDRVVHPLSPQPSEVLHALRDVSFDVRRGGCFGIVGRNGSGKTTLLRCISGIYPVDSGTVSVEARLAPFIELGVGFHPEMAARDNAIRNAVMLGLEPREAARRFPAMLAFAELERFAHMKLKNYSSGMTARLAFAVTVHVDADVLLFDEILSVGDAAFHDKCRDHFERLRTEGKTILLVTHDMRALRTICDGALLLRRGEVVAAGDPSDVASEYEDLTEKPKREDPRTVTPRTATATVRRRAVLLGPQPRRFLTLTRTLALTDFRLKYSGAALNYVWAIARPLLLFAVLLIVFTGIGRFDQGVRHYPVYLLTGIVFWTFFVQSTSASVNSLVRHTSILRRLPFPHLAVPLSVVLASILDLALNLVVVVAFAFAFGVAPRPAWLELPLLVGMLTVLATGASLLLSALYVRYRDVGHVWLVASQTLFYLSPVFYVVSSLPDEFERLLLLLNPLAWVLVEARHAFVDPTAPSAATAIGGAPFLLVPIGVTVAIFALGLWVFGRESPRAAENA
jgi:ABC-type polysaccharide/polyol phosphate transport system ATPase subunit/ABC-type polysaccharide/polyol phosphate export permease